MVEAHVNDLTLAVEACWLPWVHVAAYTYVNALIPTISTSVISADSLSSIKGERVTNSTGKPCSSD